MTYEELLAENLRLRARIRELEQENARLKGYCSSFLCEPEPPIRQRTDAARTPLLSTEAVSCIVEDRLARPSAPHR